MKMSIIRKLFKNVAKSEEGSVESALVTIPLLILFLIGMQISLSSHSRNFEKIHAQDSATTRAISGDFSEGDEFLHIESSGDGQNLDLLITRRDSGIASILPGVTGIAPRSKSVEVQGFAVIENQR